METTRNSQAGQGAPEALVKALEALADGAINMKQAQAIVVRVIEANPAVSDNVQQFMMKKLSERAITAANYLELMAALERAVAAAAERTESSEDAPDQPGIYQVAHDGTIVFDDDELPEPEPEPETETEFPELDDTGSIYSPVNNIQGKEDVAEVPEEKQEIGVGTELRDRYRLEQEVARGSMGIVYKAVDLLKLETGARDPYVAIKLVGTEFTSHSTALKSFQNEIANTQHLSHPNIVNLFELDRDNDHYFITMEWLEGESLDALLDRSAGSALPPTQTYAIIEQLCDALIYAHERDVIHADIKPGNVFLVNTGEMKLIDWGIACIEAPVGDEQSNGGFAVALTPAYASCERLEKAPPTAQDDVYALGCMIYRLLAGRRVFGSMNALAAEKEAMQPVPIGGISDSRWSAIAKALAFRRKDRFVSVKEFAEEFGKRAASRSLKEALVEEDVAEPEVHEELQAVPEPESKANKIPEEVVPDDEPDLDLELSDELLEHLNNS
ncbi:MAG: serine/threonine protein kinase, partial [Gammaproteobacteria bacterium]|nr:serine/threonine protein kinase [Gammaproteobacteria bacterium]